MSGKVVNFEDFVLLVFTYGFPTITLSTHSDVYHITTCHIIHAANAGDDDGKRHVVHQHDDLYFEFAHQC